MHKNVLHNVNPQKTGTQSRRQPVPRVKPVQRTEDALAVRPPGTMLFDGEEKYAVTGLVFKTSRFGKPVIEQGEHRYNLYTCRRMTGEIKNWRCVKWASTNCRATLITEGAVLIRAANVHNHERNCRQFRQ